MTIQMRPRAGGIPYAPARDIVYIMPSVCKDVAKRLEQRWFEPLHKFLDERGITDEDLGEACAAYCRHLVYCADDPEEHLLDVLTRAGWFDVKPEAQIAYMFYVGQCIGGMFFPGIRDVVPLGQPMNSEVLHITRYAKRLQLYMSMTRWQRYIYKKIRPWRRFLQRRAGVRVTKK